jgi:drug/metabolite transporter (DMT)-like permease
MTPPSRRQATLGVLAACASSSLGGAALVATRGLMDATDPATLATLRYGIGAACLIPLALAARLPWPRGRDAAATALLGVLLFAVFTGLLNAALALTTAARGALALSTMPFLTLLTARALGAESLTAAKLLGVACATAGVATALSGELAGTPPGAWRGDLVMVAAASCGAVYNVLARPYLRRLPTLTFTALAMLAGSAASGAVALAGGGLATLAGFGPAAWAAVAFLGIGAGALGLYLWGYGLEHAGPTSVAVTVTLNPVVALALGVALLGEAWGARLLVGLAGVVGGVLLVSMGRR